jgi:cytoskeleton protein RodZ
VIVIFVLVLLAFGAWRYMAARAMTIAEANAGSTGPKRQRQAPAAASPAPAPAAQSPAGAGTANPNMGSSAGSSAKPAEAGAQQASAGAAGKASTPIELQVRARDTCWVRMTVDGQTSVETLIAGQRKTINGKEHVELFLGNAGGVEISYNGKLLPDLGTANQSRRLTFTPTSYQ